jgi:hypothetical protein
MLPGPDHRCVPHRLHQVVDLAAGVYAVAVIMSGLLRWRLRAQWRRAAEAWLEDYQLQIAQIDPVLLDPDHDVLACTKDCCNG